MKLYRLAAVAVLLAALVGCGSGAAHPAADANTGPRGSLLIAGGAVKGNNAELFEKFIELAGGRVDARIAIFASASKTPAQSGSYYKSIFARYGVPKPNIVIVPIAEKDDVESLPVDESYWRYGGLEDRQTILGIIEDELRKADPEGTGLDRAAERVARDNGVLGADEIVDLLDGVTGVWFSGGWQGRIRDLLMAADNEGYSDGPVLTKIRELYQNGAVIGGTSAGAAIMSDPMIDGGSSLGTVLQGATYEDPYYDEGDDRVYLTRGLGFWPDGLMDQHFIRRGRFGRLIGALAETGIDLGIGVDENTAVVIKDGQVEPVGDTGAIIIDMSRATVNSLAPLNVTGVRVSYIEEKDFFNYHTGEYLFADYKPNALRGDEYYSTEPQVNGNLFAPDALLYHLIHDLMDNQADENFGFAYDSQGALSGVDAGDGIVGRFYKGPDSNGFWGRKVFSGKAHYSIVNVYLDLAPARVDVAGGF